MDPVTWIFAVDPGLITGWAVWDVQAEQPPVAGQLALEEFEDKAADIIAHGSPEAHLVVERYTVTSATAKKSPQPEALLITGALEYIARVGRGWGWSRQQPDEVMHLVPDWRLRRLGWYIKGAAGIHANDALRHVAFYASRRSWLELPVAG